MLTSFMRAMPGRQLLAALVLIPALVACAAAGGASFDPNAPCTLDGQQAGAYPALEAVLPSTYDDKAPKRLDSGRNCTETALGSLADHGIEELRFAGALWETGGRSGVTVAVFEAPGLTVEKLTEFYKQSADSARKTTEVTLRGITVDGVKGKRVDALNDESFQSILLFDADRKDSVLAVLIASDVREIETRAAHEEVVRRAAATALAP